MDRFCTFHKTVKGHLHKIKNVPCEDCSVSCEDEAGQYCIAVVADGHGDTTCMRSQTGSREAVRIAAECLKEFAENVMNEQSEEGYESINELLKIEQYNERALRPLAATIVSEWNVCVNEDIKIWPLSEEELDKAENYSDAYRNGQRLSHVYGTTLIAALMFNDYLILLQQGDGRCVVFYEDGSVEEPIPWNEKCHENVTTSMCDEDAALSLCIHSRIIHLSNKRVIACWLGSDGVEDSFRNMEGTYNFYRSIMCELIEKGEEGFEECLADMLNELSRLGSGDDISVSGIINKEGIEELVPAFKQQIEQYNLQETLERLENKKISMSRKHEKLRKEKENAEKSLKVKKKYLSDKENEVKEAQRLYESMKSEYDEYNSSYVDIQDKIDCIKEKMNINKEENILEEDDKNAEYDDLDVENYAGGTDKTDWYYR